MDEWNKSKAEPNSVWLGIVISMAVGVGFVGSIVFVLLKHAGWL